MPSHNGVHFKYPEKKEKERIPETWQWEFYPWGLVIFIIGSLAALIYIILTTP